MTDCYISAWIVTLTVKQTCTITLYDNLISEFAFVHLRYFLGGHRPSQTTFHKLSFVKN